MERSDKAVVGETNKTPSTMNEGDAGYGSVPGRGQPGSAADSETAPLLSPEPGAEPGQQRNSLTKEEVEVVAGGPRWRRLRCYLVVVFWLILVAILAAAITIILLSPRPVVTPLKWWQKSLFYRVQPALFTEAHTRGSGDMNALCEQFPYLKSLGVGTLILEGLFEEATPLNASGTGERYGMLRQIQHLITESNKTGLKMVLDLCELNLLGPDDVTRDAATVQHALRFWLHQGVAGFAICDTDAAFSEKTLLEWRGVLEDFSSEEEERLVVVKQTRNSLPLNTFTQPNVTLVDVVMRSILPSSHHHLGSHEVAAAIRTRLQMSEDKIWPSWTIGGKASPDLKKLLLVLMMTLPGSPAIQYDEEMDQTQDKETSSILALFTSLSHVRAREEPLLCGNFTFLPFNTSANSTLSSHPILAFQRSWGCVHFLILLNVWPEHRAVDPHAWAQSLPQTGLFVTSTGMDRQGLASLYTLELQPHEAIVIKL